jgi:hypothetical protein
MDKLEKLVWVVAAVVVVVVAAFVRIGPLKSDITRGRLEYVVKLEKDGPIAAKVGPPAIPGKPGPAAKPGPTASTAAPAAPAKPTTCPEHYKLDPWGGQCVKDN